jgi:hypothetical protein
MSTATRRPHRPGLASVSVTALALAAGVLGVTMWRADQSGTETVSCLSGDRTIQCTLGDGSDVSVPLDVAWTDARSQLHQDGRPDCLPPSGRGLEGPVRVQWTEVDVEGTQWRQVVWVGC